MRDDQKDQIRDDIWDGLAKIEFLNVDTFAFTRLFPKVGNRSASKEDDNLRSDPPDQNNRSHRPEDDAEPWIRKYASVEKKNGKLDYGDGRRVDVSEYEEYQVPVVCSIGRTCSYVFSKAKVNS